MKTGWGDRLRGEVLGAWAWVVGVGAVGQSDSGKIWEPQHRDWSWICTGIGRGQGSGLSREGENWRQS